MSDKNIIEKAADVVGNITKFQKQSKLKSAYVEREEFKDSNLHSTQVISAIIVFIGLIRWVENV